MLWVVLGGAFAVGGFLRAKLSKRAGTHGGDAGVAGATGRKP